MAKNGNGSSNGSTPMPGILQGGLRGLVGKDKDYDATAFKAVEQIREECPIVAEILGGCKATSTEPAFPPGAISIFFREGRLSFSAKVNGVGKTIFGLVADIANPWGSINSAILMGECSQKDTPVRTLSDKQLAELPH